MLKLKAGVIGCGNMGSNHLRVLSELSEVELVAISEVEKEKGIEVAKKHSIRCYADFLEMIEKETLDFVSICVPTSLHWKVARKCIENGIHVLLEKPITDNISDAEDLLNLAKQKQVKLFVGHIERFNPIVLKLIELIAKRRIGDIISIIARRVGVLPPQIKDADIAIDMVIHDVDIINYLLNELPRKINSVKRKTFIDDRADTVEFFIEYSRAIAYIQANWITPIKIRKLNITGTDGYLEMDYINQKIKLHESSDKDNYFIISVDKKEPLKEEILFFIRSINNDEKVDSQFALDALKIVLS